jgi:hypothetical protein
VDGAPLLVRPPDVPDEVPNADWWQDRDSRYDRFRPLPMPSAKPMPHIRMDAALEFLLGDKLR